MQLTCRNATVIKTPFLVAVHLLHNVKNGDFSEPRAHECDSLVFTSKHLGVLLKRNRWKMSDKDKHLPF